MDRIAQDILKVVRELLASIDPADYIILKNPQITTYGLVLEKKGRDFKVVSMPEGGHAQVESTKHWRPDPVKIQESKVPSAVRNTLRGVARSWAKKQKKDLKL